MAVRITAFDHTLVGKQVHSEEQVLGSIPSASKFVPKVFAARWRLLRKAPSKGHHRRYITLFFKGMYSVLSFYELMRMSYARLRYFLR